ncbi:hypothetical protein ACFWGD_10585 [Corynebacterium sp. NPDC060344]|uniref:hypothetical protein n=1 Tax=Corynebacterium sp. NPDC060344 TaxID=3347101 RepID=UPI0036643550
MSPRTPAGLPPSPPLRAGAPAVVLAGGVGVPARKWAGVVAGLERPLLDDAHAPSSAPISWIAVERPGLGRRRGHRLGDVPEFADEVARIVHELRRCRDAGASPVVLAAHSAAGFLAEAAVRANPGLVDGVLLIDVSVVEDAGRPFAPYETVSHVVGLVSEPLVRRAVPGMRRGELPSLLLENAVFGRWARELRELRDLRPGDTAPVTGAVSANSTDPAEKCVTAVTDVVAVPKRVLWRAGSDADAASDVSAEFVADLPGRAAHLRTWRGLAGGADSLREVILAPCPHMVMSHRPDDVASEIRALIARTSATGRDSGPAAPGAS